MNNFDEVWVYRWTHKSGLTGIGSQSRFSPDLIRHRTIYEAVDYWNKSYDFHGIIYTVI